MESRFALDRFGEPYPSDEAVRERPRPQSAVRSFLLAMGGIRARVEVRKYLLRDSIPLPLFEVKLEEDPGNSVA